MKWFIIIALLLVACNNFSNKEYEESKEQMLEKEKKNPLDFLAVSHSDKRNLLGQTVVRGIIKNNASVASYKRVRVKMLYYNAEGKLVTNHEEVIEDKIGPNSEVKFKAKYFTPKGTDSVALSIMEAEIVNEQAPENKN